MFAQLGLKRFGTHEFGKKMLGVLLAFLALAELTACETRVEQPQYADLTYNHLGQIELNVAEIKVVKAYQPSASTPHVELEFPVSPLETAARWATDRLKAVGTEGTVTVTITDASVLEEILEKKDGITGAFTTDQSERYTGTFSVKIEAENPNGHSALTSGTIQRSITVPEDVSLNERSKAWYGMTEKMMSDLDKQMVENIKNHLKGFTF